MLSLLCFRILIWIAPLWRGRGSPVEYQKGYVLAHLLLWTVGLVRNTAAMAEGLLGLLTEQSSTSHPHASGVKGDAGQWLLPLMFSVVLELEVGATLKVALPSACPAGRPPRAARASIFIMEKTQKFTIHD